MSREHGLAFYLATGTFVLGYARWRTGERQSGEADMRLGKRMLGEQGQHLWLPLYEACRAETEAETSHVDSAIATLHDAFAESERTGQHAELHRVRGDILLRVDRPDFTAAEAAFARAIEIARSQRTRSFELRATLALAKLYHETQRNEAARALLRPALEGFSPTQEFLEIEQAQTLLAALNS